MRLAEFMQSANTYAQLSGSFQNQQLGKSIQIRHRDQFDRVGNYVTPRHAPWPADILSQVQADGKIYVSIRVDTPGSRIFASLENPDIWINLDMYRHKKAPPRLCSRKGSQIRIREFRLRVTSGGSRPMPILS